MSSSIQHIPVLLDESVSALITSGEGVYVDGTFGRGGHSREILDRLSPSGRLIAIDKDPDAEIEARKIDDDRLDFKSGCFSELTQMLSHENIYSVDGLIIDLGVSAPQLQNAQRGFSFLVDGPLDMRMDNTSGEPISEWLANATEADIADVIRSYGEDRFAKRVARGIVFNRKKSTIKTTLQLAAIVKKSVLVATKNKNPATKTFQALRIYTNKELDVLRMFLPQSIDCLRPGGRLVVISFHSLEDRIVKQFMKSQSLPPVFPKEIPLTFNDIPKPKIKLVGKPIFPTKHEVDINPKARSAVLRVSERMAA